MTLPGVQRCPECRRLMAWNPEGSIFVCFPCPELDGGTCTVESNQSRERVK